MRDIDLATIMQAVWHGSIRPRLQLLTQGLPDVPAEKLEAFIRELNPTAVFGPGEAPAYAPIVALYRASAYDPDPDSYAHQIDDARQITSGGWTFVVSSPSQVDKPAPLLRLEAYRYWKDWAAIPASALGGGPFGVNVVHWEQGDGAQHADVFTDQYLAVQLRRFESLARLAARLRAFLGVAGPGAQPGPQGHWKGEPGPAMRPMLSNEQKGNALGLAMLGGMFLLFLATRKGK